MTPFERLLHLRARQSQVAAAAAFRDVAFYMARLEKVSLSGITVISLARNAQLRHAYHAAQAADYVRRLEVLS